MSNYCFISIKIYDEKMILTDYSKASDPIFKL